MIVHPKEIDTPLSNPWMGWGLWAGPIYFDGTPRTLEENTVAFGDDAPLFSWVLLDWMWADLEPQEGKFAWEPLDEIIQYWAQRGKQINLRIWVTDDPGWNGAPGATWACPKWVYDAGLRWRDYRPPESGVTKREPDYIDPSFQTIFIPRLQNLLNAVAERYDHPGHPFNFIGNMSYGQWGEWHTMWSNYYWPSREIKHDVLTKLVNLYADTFKHVDLAISSCFDSFNIGDLNPLVHDNFLSFAHRLARDNADDFLYRQGLDVALKRGYMLGRHGYIDGIFYTDRVIMEREWKNRAFYAEANWSYMDVKNHGTHGTVDENIDVMVDWHSSYGHFYTDAASYRRTMREDAQAFERGLKAGGLGYRLVLQEAAWPDSLKPGQLLVLRQLWVNRNTARLYKHHVLMLYLINAHGETVYTRSNSAFDPSNWVNGEEYRLRSMFQLPKDLPGGTYTLAVALCDLEGTPRIALAIEGKDDQLRYVLGQIRIE